MAGQLIGVRTDVATAAYGVVGILREDIVVGLVTRLYWMHFRAPQGM